MSPPPRPGEFELIARYFAPLAGPGGLGLIDDAALLTPPPGHDLVLTKDALVAGVHFFADDPPVAIAAKALRVNFSDLTAKGATPLGYILGLGLPADWTEPWLREFAQGLKINGEAYACPLLGGDTVAGRHGLFLSVTAIGAVPAGTMVKRAAGRPGDALFVGGTIGDAALGLLARAAEREGRTLPWLPDAQDAARLIMRYLVPPLRNRLAPVVRDHARAAMDVSDGLVGDAVKLAAASGCGLDLRLADIPLSDEVRRAIAREPSLLKTAVTGGDDYEVLCAVAPEDGAAFVEAAWKAGVRLTEIGALTAGESRILDAEGREADLGAGSFRHF